MRLKFPLPPIKKPEAENRPRLYAPPPPSPAELDHMERERAKKPKDERGVGVVDFYI